MTTHTPITRPYPITADPALHAWLATLTPEQIGQHLARAGAALGAISSFPERDPLDEARRLDNDI